MYLLDTNACIRILKKSSLSVVKRLQQQDSKNIKLCSIVKAELLYGAHHSERIEKNLQLLNKFLNHSIVSHSMILVPKNMVDSEQIWHLKVL